MLCLGQGAAGIKEQEILKPNLSAVGTVQAQFRQFRLKVFTDVLLQLADPYEGARPASRSPFARTSSEPSLSLSMLRPLRSFSTLRK